MTVKTLSQLPTQQDELLKPRHGLIIAHSGVVQSIVLKRVPKLLAWPDLFSWSRRRRHCRGEADTCWLYYNQPRRFRNFLALKYIVSSEGTSRQTFSAALRCLDWVASVKKSDALLCDVANGRLRHSFLTSQGWQTHKPQRWHRNYVKRFYGEYPTAELTCLFGFKAVQVPKTGDVVDVGV